MSPPLSRLKVMMAEMERMAQKMKEGVAERTREERLTEGDKREI